MQKSFDHTQFEEELSRFIQSNCNHAELLQSLRWATLPAGKLFRPKIFYALLQDLQSTDKKDAFYIGAALELHHAYTLVHDDLPCMDDDQFRRGKLSTHAKFGEWKAVLTGDALLNLSYYALSQVQSSQALKIISLFSQKLGANGLILGQWLDLQYEKSQTKKDLSEIINIHRLKTGELIEVALMSAVYLSENFSNTQTINSICQISHSLGICFQLLDDVSELTSDLSTHEQAINPFINQPKKTTEILLQQLELLNVELIKWPILKENIRHYIIPMKETISSVKQEEIISIVQYLNKF